MPVSPPTAPNAGAPPSEIQCSFCGKPQREVRKLVAGPAAYICDECIGLCNNIIAAEAVAPLRARAAVAPGVLRRSFDARVEGHDAAKRALVAALRQQALDAGAAVARSPRVLLVGPCGSGKTTLGHALCDAAGTTSYLGDVGRLSESGYVGDDVEHMVASLLDACGGSVEAAESGVLVLDGVEKLRARQPLTVARDISGEFVQRELLRLLDGLTLEMPRRGPRHPQTERLAVRTRGMLVVATVRLDEAALPAAGSADREVRDALLAAGLVGAFVARFDRIVRVPRQGAAEMTALLLRERGLLAETSATIERLGGSLRFDGGAIRVLADAAGSSAEGGWLLRHAMQRLLEEVFLAEQPARPWQIDVPTALRLVGGN